MNIEEFRDYCLSLQGVNESQPFGPNALVYKIGSKMFALCNLNEEIFSFNLKNLPSKNIDLQENYSFIKPGFHMNKTHWITVEPQSNFPLKFYTQLIRESYEIILENSVSKKEKESLNLI